MRFTLLFLTVLTVKLCLSASEIKIKSDKDDFRCEINKETIFTISVSDNNAFAKEGKVIVRMSDDGGRTVYNNTIDITKSGNPFQVSGVLNKPSFLRINASFLSKTAWSAVAYEPEKIKPATAMPEDFMEFWKDGLRELEKIPADIRLTALPEYSKKNYDCWRISFASINGTRVYGFLSVPKGRTGKFPAMVSFVGAGPGFYLPNENEVNNGIIVLRLNVHNYAPPFTREDWLQKARELQKLKVPYYFQGIETRETYFYRAPILGISRAIDYLAGRQDYNGKGMIAEGQSQGGTLALIAAALNENITGVIADVPAFCDLGAKSEGRNPGFPGIYKLAEGKEDVLKYYDVVNFCRFVKVPVLMSAGFVDLSCSPGSVFAAYNTLNVPKKMFAEPEMSHKHSPLLEKYRFTWIADHFKGVSADGVLKQPPSIK